jgi:hypothetical protein
MPEERTVMDEVNAALGEVIADAPETEETTNDGDTTDTTSQDGEGSNESEVADSESSSDADDDSAAEDAEVKSKAGETGPNGERERNPDGTWKKNEEKQEKPEKQTKTEVKKDPINDPIPKDLKKETSERIRTLIDTTKTVTADRDEVKQNFDYMVNGIQATGATPEQYGETLSWLALFNSRDPAQQEKALELVETVAERLATLLGKERTVGDPLSAHSDLKDAVTKGQITAQYAKEIARTRNGQTFRSELSTNAQQAEQRQAQAAQELQTARNDLSTLEQTLKASDTQYEAKKAILVPALKPVFASIPPAQWKQKFQEAYRAINVGAAPKPVVKGAPTNQPLRAGKQPAGGQTKAPGSMLEAISGALAGMGGK